MYVCISNTYFCTYTGVLNLRDLKITANTITIVWDPADSPNCGPVLDYTVTIVNTVYSNDMNTTQSNKTRVEFSNLINDTSYNISVTVVNRAGTGPASSTIVDVEGNLFIAYVYVYVLN